MRYLFKKELAIVPEGKFEDAIPYKDKSLWNKSLSILGLMVILFVIHNTIHWEPWMVAGTGGIRHFRPLAIQTTVRMKATFLMATPCR